MKPERSVNLAILATEGTATTAYLNAFLEAGCRPAHILDLRLIPRYPITSRLVKTIGKRSTWILISLFRFIQLNKPSMRRLAKKILQTVENPPDFFSRVEYRKFTKAVTTIYAFGLGDPVLVEFLKNTAQKTWLYSTSGIMPEVLLNLPGKKFVHIHPGVVPYVRGGDCLLWSRAVRGKPGMSCFYMNAGIDTGDIIVTREFESVRFKIDPQEFSESQIYEAVMAFYDVLLRANVLRELLVSFRNSDFDQLPNEKQDPAVGRTYFTMHPKLRKRVVQKLFLAT